MSYDQGLICPLPAPRLNWGHGSAIWAPLLSRRSARRLRAHVASGAQAGAERLVGRSVRPGGGYVLEIRSAQADGRLDAAYLNSQTFDVEFVRQK